MLKRACAAAVALIAACGPAFGQDAAATYPNKFVRVIVPFAAGGTTDLLARLVAQGMSESLGQQFVVENRVGAGGNRGADAVAKAEPDGYTIGFGTISSHAINPSLYAKMPYDNLKDFAPITLVASQPNMLVVHPSLGVNTVPELIANLKANPGRHSFASSGVGTSIHLAGELFKIMTGTDMNHVPYRSSGQLMNDLVAGHVPIAFDNMSSGLPQAQAGKVKALGVGSKERSPAAPNVPAIAEFLPGFESVSWHGMFAPAATPRPIVMKLNQEAKKALQKPEVATKLAELGITPIGNSPEEFAVFVKDETERWAKVVKQSGAKAE